MIARGSLGSELACRGAQCARAERQRSVWTAGLALALAGCAVTHSPEFGQASQLCRSTAETLCAPLRHDLANSGLCQHGARLRCLRQLGWVHVGRGEWQRRGAAADLEHEVDEALRARGAMATSAAR